MKFLKVTILSLGVLLAACASYDLQQAMRPGPRHIAQRLPNMEPIFEAGKALDNNTTAAGANTTSVQLNNEFATLFRREVERNLIDINGPIKGKLVLEPIFVKVEESGAWPLTMLPLFIPNLLGAPFDAWEAKWEVELNVLDKTGRRLARYSGEVENTEYAAAYWGYKQALEARKAAVFEGYKKALDNVIKQLEDDIPRLTPYLK